MLSFKEKACPQNALTHFCCQSAVSSAGNRLHHGGSPATVYTVACVRKTFSLLLNLQSTTKLAVDTYAISVASKCTVTDTNLTGI